MELEPPIGAALNRDLTDDREVVDEFTEQSWKESERKAQARRARENRASWLDYQRHLRSAYLALYYQKDQVVKQLERRSSK